MRENHHQPGQFRCPRKDAKPRPGLTRSNRAAQQAASLFRILANPTRLAILLTLQDREQRIAELTAQLGGPQASISAQLTRLKQAGLITSRTQGRAVYYCLTQPELGSLLQAAGQLLATAGQQATEENDTTVRKTQPTTQ